MVAALLLTGCTTDEGSMTDDDIAALSATALRQRLAEGELSSVRVTTAFLGRIAALDDAGPMLNAIIEVNSDAMAIARSLDEAYARSGPVGPLHGMPVVLKANIDTADSMATSAGSLAMADHHPDADAPLVANLRAAGAVILAKTNMSEWAFFRASDGVSGWSSLGGQTRNPYVLDRNPCGSSSGSAVAVAAELAPLAVGTETDGSIVCPAGVNGVVGIKPTYGSVSQRGIVPIAASQDIAGPLARDVAGAALMLEVLTGVPLDSMPTADLRGRRLGVIRDYYGAGRRPRVEAAYAEALGQLHEAGAELVDPVTLSLDAAAFDAESTVLLYEFKAGLNDYLRDTAAPYPSLEALIAYNTEHAETVMPIFGQDLFEAAQATQGLDDPAYAAALAASRQRVRDRLADVFATHTLDALVVPTNGPAWKIDWLDKDRYAIGSATPAAVSGYPSISVPAGLIQGLPVGISFTGRPDSEPDLVGMAAAFERVRGPFPGPTYTASLELPK